MFFYVCVFWKLEFLSGEDRVLECHYKHVRKYVPKVQLCTSPDRFTRISAPETLGRFLRSGCSCLRMRSDGALSTLRRVMLLFLWNVIFYSFMKYTGCFKMTLERTRICKFFESQIFLTWIDDLYGFLSFSRGFFKFRFLKIL